MTPLNLSGQVRREGDSVPQAILRQAEDWGLISVDLAGPPRRFWADGEQPPVPVVDMGIDANRVEALPTPASLLAAHQDVESWAALTRRSRERLRAYFLVGEDPQRRLDARAVNTLAHQVSLVRHILDSPSLKRVLIADEVGLGKTVEAGLIIQELLNQNSGLRVLYLAPARLVRNVRRELNRLDLPFRQWTAVEKDANLTDPLVVASIHKATAGSNDAQMLASGPWDVLIVDECHHLSDWEPGGGSPKENFKLVKELIAKLPDEARVIFMSGTPHQGHEAKFQNLLNLLRTDGESTADLAGRVIFRTKDDVTDWDGAPLFPKRKVRPALLFEASDRYQGWLREIYAFYNPGDVTDDSDAVRRAAGWRCAQALQWAASSPQAGLGYLVRQAIRANWKIETRNLRDALAALRPYRFGPADEPIPVLFDRLTRDVGLQKQGEAEDLEDVEGAGSQVDNEGLARLLASGLDVLTEAGDSKWNLLKEQVLDPAKGERVVLFAQPIETVTALGRYLERTYGTTPAVIIGGQSDKERQEQIDKFCSRQGPQFLVSSRAGGEGINLQIARRLVHIDVPWNPMEMEQRVGRVHRFGSRETILVDTMVMRGSREEAAYAAANQKLRVIVETLVEPDRVDALFARVMSLIPPEQLQNILLRDAPGGTPVDTEGIGQLVQAGFTKWKRFFETYSAEQRKIQAMNPGLAAWDDVDAFLAEYSDAMAVPGFAVQRFEERDGEVRLVDRGARVITFDGKTHYACGDYSGSPVFGPEGRSAEPLGLNVPAVTAALRRAAFPSDVAGAAHLRWPDGLALPVPTSSPFGVLVLLRQSLRMAQATWVEGAMSLHCYLIGEDGNPVPLDQPEQRGALIRGLFKATVKVKPHDAPGLVQRLVEQEASLAGELRRITREQFDEGLRYAVSPLFAGIIGPA
ncbi:MAG: DEAD/DEAH box helicase [Vicinamibacterales bacterium]